MLDVKFERWDLAERRKCSQQWQQMATENVECPTWTSRLRATVLELVLSCVAPGLVASSMQQDVHVPILLDALTDLYNVLLGRTDVARIMRAYQSRVNASSAEDSKSSGGSKTDSHINPLPPVATPAELATFQSVHDYFDCLLDALNLAEYSRCFIDKQHAGRLGELVTRLMHSHWFPSKLLAEQLPEELLESAPVLNRGVCGKVMQRHRTQQLYTLPLYTLAFEELEGYMNLVTEVGAFSQTALPKRCFVESPDSCQMLSSIVDEFWNKIDSIIVTHKIARMRVADVLLRAFAVRLTTHWPLFIALFARVSFNQLSYILGFLLRATSEPFKLDSKNQIPAPQLDLHRASSVSNHNVKDPYLSRLDRTLQVYQDRLPAFLEGKDTIGDQKLTEERITRDWSNIEIYLNKTAAHVAPNAQNLFLAAALLIKYELVDLSSILAHMPRDPECPIESVVSAPYKEPAIAADNNASPIFDADMLMIVKPMVEAMQVDGEEPKPSSEEQINQHTMAVVTAFQIAALIISLLAVGDHVPALKIMRAYPVDWCLVCPRVSSQLLRLTNWILGGRSGSSSRGEPVINTKVIPDKQYFFYQHWTSKLKREDLDTAQLFLDMVGHCLFLSPEVVMRLVDRLPKREDLDGGFTIEHQLDDPIFTIYNYALPAFSLMNPTGPPQVSDAMWEVIREWSPSERFTLYHYWQNTLYTRTSDLMWMRYEQICKTIRYWMKRISKDVIREYRQRLSILVLGNSIPVLQHVVATVMNYDNLGHSVLECLKSVGPFVMDALVYTLLSALTDPARSNVQRSANAALLAKSEVLGKGLKDEGINLDSWMINTSQFMANWLAQYPRTDFSPLLCYLDRPLPVDSAARSLFSLSDAKVLSDLISNMTGIEPIAELSIQTVKALESRDCVAQRLRTPAASIASKSQPSDQVKGRSESASELVKRMEEGQHLSRFAQHLDHVYGQLAERSIDGWKDYEVLEKVRTSDLLVELQWKDRIRSYVFQYELFLRLYAPDVARPKRVVNTESRNCPLFSELRYYHVHFDPGMYLPPEEEERELHLNDYATSMGRVAELCAQAAKLNTKPRESASHPPSPVKTVADNDVAMADADSVEEPKKASPAPSAQNSDRYALEPQAGDKLLPTSTDLIRRACTSAADAMYSCFWAEKVSVYTLIEVVQHAWAIRGMTESEASNYGILLERVLKILHRNVDASKNTEYEISSMAASVLKAHQDFIALSKSALHENSDLYLVRNVLNVLKRITAEFPAVKQHAETLRKMLALHINSESLRVMVLVVEGAIKAAMSKGYPLESKLIPKPPALQDTSTASERSEGKVMLNNTSEIHSLRDTVDPQSQAPTKSAGAASTKSLAPSLSEQTADRTSSAASEAAHERHSTYDSLESGEHADSPFRRRAEMTLSMARSLDADADAQAPSKDAAAAAVIHSSDTVQDASDQIGKSDSEERNAAPQKYDDRHGHAAKSEQKSGRVDYEPFKSKEGSGTLREKEHERKQEGSSERDQWHKQDQRQRHGIDPSPARERAKSLGADTSDRASMQKATANVRNPRDAAYAHSKDEQDAFQSRNDHRQPRGTSENKHFARREEPREQVNVQARSKSADQRGKSVDNASTDSTDARSVVPKDQNLKQEHKPTLKTSGSRSPPTSMHESAPASAQSHQESTRTSTRAAGQHSAETHTSAATRVGFPHREPEMQPAGKRPKLANENPSNASIEAQPRQPAQHGMSADAKNRNASPRAPIRPTNSMLNRSSGSQPAQGRPRYQLPPPPPPAPMHYKRSYRQQYHHDDSSYNQHRDYH